MSKEDFIKLINFEKSRGQLDIDDSKIDVLYQKYCTALENDDYYQSLDPESDAAYCLRDDLFDEIVMR